MRKIGKYPLRGAENVVVVVVVKRIKTGSSGTQKNETGCRGNTREEVWRK